MAAVTTSLPCFSVVMIKMKHKLLCLTFSMQLLRRAANKNIGRIILLHHTRTLFVCLYFILPMFLPVFRFNCSQDFDNNFKFPFSCSLRCSCEYFYFTLCSIFHRCIASPAIDNKYLFKWCTPDVCLLKMYPIQCEYGFGTVFAGYFPFVGKNVSVYFYLFDETIHMHSVGLNMSQVWCCHAATFTLKSNRLVGIDNSRTNECNCRHIIVK